jgi:hypothetical protein
MLLRAAATECKELVSGTPRMGRGTYMSTARMAGKRASAVTARRNFSSPRQKNDPAENNADLIEGTYTGRGY